MSDISQTELLEAQATSTKLQIHTALPARVVSFDAATQTVSIELMIEQMDYQGNQLSLPPLVDVPVKMFAWGEFMITATPQVGDEGLATFSERCIDGWWESSRKSIPMDIRFHDLSDAFFDGGYRSKPNALTIVPNCLNIAGESNYIRLNSDGTIEINGVAMTVNAPTTFAQPVVYQAGMTGTGGISVSGNVESTDGDIVATGKSFLSHTNGGYTLD